MEEDGVDTVIASGPIDPECRITRGLSKAYTIQRYRGENMEIFENILHFILHVLKINL